MIKPSALRKLVSVRRMVAFAVFAICAGVLSVAFIAGRVNGSASSPAPSSFATADPSATASPPPSAKQSITPPPHQVYPRDPSSYGITATEAGPFSASEFTARTRYQGAVGQTLYVVFSGGKRLDPSGVTGLATTPALIVYVAALVPDDQDNPWSQLGEYSLPRGSGTATIVNVSNGILQLLTDDGQTATFALSTQTFG